MPPRPQIPNQPAGMPTWYSPSGPPPSEGWTPQSPGTSGRPRFVNTANGPMTLPSDWSEDDANAWVKSYDQHIATLTQAWQQSSGLQRKQIEAQIEDARKGRENAMEIARLQAETSRYGIDQQTKVAMDRLKEDQRQFDARQGMDRAKVATEYLSSPDRFVQASNFLDLSSHVLNGTYRGASPTPQPKTMADFDALTAGGNPGRQVGLPAGGGAQGRTTEGPGSGTDARVKAMKAVLDAAPPSDEPGLDNNAYAVLDAAKAIYGMNLTPRQQAAIGSDKEYQQMLGSAGRRLGHNTEAWWQRQQRSLPGQGRANAA